MTEQRTYIIKLLASALNGYKSDEKPETVSYEDIYREAARQCLLPVIFCAVNMLEQKPEKELFAKWQTAFMRETFKSERMQREAKELSCALADNGVPVMLLKGCVVQSLYPEPVYRSMSDIDLLFFAEEQTFQRIMESLGYTKTATDECHDIYYKGHYTRIETHRRLFPRDSIYSALFEDIRSRALADSERPSLLRMTDEDAYLHLLCHAAKHYKSSGIGLRVLADIYVMRKAHRDTLNYTYINEKLNSAGLLRFKDMLELIADAWLGGGEIELPQAAEDEFFLGTVYGSGDTAAMRKASEKKNTAAKAKLLYYLKIIFLPMSGMKAVYPVLNKRPWLLPACQVHRWFCKLLFGKDKIKAVKHCADLVNDENIKRQNDVFSFFGLSEERVKYEESDD